MHTFWYPDSGDCANVLGTVCRFVLPSTWQWQSTFWHQVDGRVWWLFRLPVCVMNMKMYTRTISFRRHLFELWKRQQSAHNCSWKDFAANFVSVHAHSVWKNLIWKKERGDGKGRKEVVIYVDKEMNEQKHSLFWYHISFTSRVQGPLISEGLTTFSHLCWHWSSDRLLK